jgi:citrate synthase
MGALKGRSHGGANEKVMQMLLEIDAVEKAEAYLDQKLKKGELIMGFGHRVYHDGDSRVPIMSGFAKTLGERLGITKWSEMAAVITSAMRHEKGLHPNIDFPSAYTYYLLGIPIELYTSLFVAARIAGWTAHLIEQHDDNRLIRPISVYEGATEAQWVPIDNRC